MKKMLSAPAAVTKISLSNKMTLAGRMLHLLLISLIKTKQNNPATNN